LTAARFSVSGIADMWRRRVPRIMERLKRINRRAADTASADVDGPRVTEAQLKKQLGDYVKATEALLNAVGDRLAADATQALADGLNAGEDVGQLKARLTALFLATGSELGPTRAQRIAATEATRAWNAATLAAAKQLTGPDRPLVKQWVTRRDTRVREAHADANGQLQLLDDPFNVGGVDMRYPGDPTAPASLTVNCRCVMRTATAARPTEGNDVTADLTAGDGAAGEELQSRMPPQLKAYWLTGEGAAKIGWGTPGSFDRCVSNLRDDFPKDPEGLCANLYHEATGKWPGANRDAGETVTAGADVHTGAMVALMPTEADAARLALEGGEAVDQLHLTLFYLGEAAAWNDEQRADLATRISYGAKLLTPVTARVFGASTWNPQSDEPAYVWNVGDDNGAESNGPGGAGTSGSKLADAHFEARWALEDGHNDPELPQQYTPWSPHVCAAYGNADLAAMAERVGPITFDRIRVAFAGEYLDFPLSAGLYQEGDRVMVRDGAEHEGHHADVAGEVVEINDGPAYGIRFDGTDEVHHWYVGDELMAEEPAPEAVEPAPDPYANGIIGWSTPGEAALAFENQQTGDGRVFTPGALYWDGAGPWPLQYADEMEGGHDGAELAGAIESYSRDGDRIAGSGVLYLTQSAGVEAALLLSQGAPLGVSVDLDDVDLEMVDNTGGAPVELAEGELPDGPYRARLLRASLLPLPDGGYLLTGETAAEWTASGVSLAGEASRMTFHIGPDGTVPAGAFELAAAAGDADNAAGVVLDRQRAGDYLMRITRARVRGATLVTIPAYANARIVLDQPLTASAELTAAADADDYETAVRYVRQSKTPVSAADAAHALKMSIIAVRRHLAAASRKGHLVRIARGTYVRNGDGAPVNPVSKPSFLLASDSDELDADELTAAATGAVDLPVAPRDHEWDGDGAKDRVFTWADGDTGKIGQAFAYMDDDMDASLKGAWKLGYADVVDGTLTIIPKGVSAALGAVNGARGGADLKGDTAAVKDKLTAVQAHVDESLGQEGQQQMEASAWTAMKDMPAMPASWFREPTAEELPPGGAGVNYANGRIFGWVAQAGEPHAGFAKKITIDGLGRIDTQHFLRQRFTLDDGSTVKAGAFTMNAGHHRDGAECETAACQFDDTRFVAGIVTVGMNERGMWFSGAAAPWLSEWDRSVFMACQPSYHMRKGTNGQWQLRAVLSVPVPGHSSPLMASAVAERAQMALTAAATMAEVEEAVAAENERQAADELTQHDQDAGYYNAPQIDYDRLAAAIITAQEAATLKKQQEAEELAALQAEAAELDDGA
jgi:F like protein